MRIYRVPHLDGNPTPARCNRRTGEIWINESVWHDIEPQHRLFILLHELGHIELNTSNEIAVDNFAYNRYIQMGYPLTESVKALSRVLTGKLGHPQRLLKQIERAKQTDKFNTMCKTKLGGCNCTNCNGTQSKNLFADPQPWYDVEDFEGCDASKLKPRQYRKCVRTTGKAMAKTTRAEGAKALKEGKGKAAEIKAEAKRILSEQGIVDNADDGLKGVINSVGRALKNKPDEAAPNTSEAAPNTSKKTPWLWIGIGAGALVITTVLILVLNRKK